MEINKTNPILYGLVAGIITYIVLYVDVNFENKRLNFKKSNTDGKCICPKFYVTLKVPIMIGALVWTIISYFYDLNQEQEVKELLSNTTTLFDQDLFTDMPDF
tara:strand:- start:1508 stop:1816 length:309 start_codon:yes stop_codon:yes gene_type:complete